MTDRPYTPISCSVHDRLLAAATLRQECGLTVGVPGGAPQAIRGIIEDVYSRGGVEFLRLRGGATFRLDDLLALEGEAIGPETTP